MRNMRFLIPLLFPILLSGCRLFPSHKTTERLFLSDVSVSSGQTPGAAWEFSCSAGRRSGEQATIPVPSYWELEGFGTLDSEAETSRTPVVGYYRRTFRMPESWRGRRVRLVFEGVMTDADVTLNGKSAGPKHQGGFYRFQYDVTDLLHETERDNVLEVAVSQVSSNPSVAAAERLPGSWILSGIYRPVYLEALPRESVDWLAIDARADGTFSADLHLSGVTAEAVARGQIRTLKGRRVGDPFEVTVGAGAMKALLRGKVSAPLRWSAETPHLYVLDLKLERDGETLHRLTQRFGFRTIELQPNDGFYLNGRQIRLKGVDRRSFESDPRRSLSPDAPRAEARFLKSLNLNAVRLADGPADPTFLDACDEVGLYVLNELAGCPGAAYDLAVGRELVRGMVMRDANHPSVLMWTNGGEGGGNKGLVGEFHLFDRQRREVLCPGEFFAGVEAASLNRYDALQEKLARPVVFLPTGLLRGLPEAGVAAGLSDFWKVMSRAPNCAGGILSVADYPGLLPPSTQRVPLSDWSMEGRATVSGGLGEGLETLRAVWSPIQIDARDLPPLFEGGLEVENRYDFLNLDQITFEWQVVDWGGPFPAPKEEARAVWASGRLSGPDVDAGWRGAIHLPLPDGWQSHDALELRAWEPGGREVETWSWSLRKPGFHADSLHGTDRGEPQGTEQAETLSVTAGDIVYRFDRHSGCLLDVTVRGQTLPFGKGPRRIASPVSAGETLREVSGSAPVRHGLSDAGYRVEAGALGGFDRVTWTVRRDGCLILDYAGREAGAFDSLGVAFDYGQTPVRRVRWLGDGPGRVWRNRIPGPRFGVHALDLESDAAVSSGTVVSETSVPERFLSRVQWAVLEISGGSVWVAPVGEEPLSLGLGGAPDAAGHKPLFLTPEQVAFLTVIPAMGTEESPAAQLGPEGEAVKVRGEVKGRLLFCFENPF